MMTALRTNVPAGIELREWENGKVTLRIAFTYRGVRCRETLNLQPTPANIKYAANLRGEILNAITKGTFNYPDYFPSSKRARFFGYRSNKITIRELLIEYLEHAEQTLEYSSYLSYFKNTRKHLIPAFGQLPVSEVSHSLLCKWIKAQKVTVKTVNNILTPLKHVVHNALVDELITHDPLAKIQPAKLIARKNSQSDFKVDPFSRDEINAILGAASGQVKNLFQFAFFTGLRTG